MNIQGLNKVTLLDYPGRVACTVFTGGCDLRCPFCHNSQLVLHPTFSPIDEEEVFALLRRRRGIIDGVAITGGEPLLNSGIDDFAARVHEAGFLVKLDTNGSIYDRLERFIKNGLCDYVAMDIKNTPEKYALSAGCFVDVENVKKSVELLKRGFVDYEFRTTVVKELNAKEDFAAIGEWLCGAKKYYLQKFKDSENVPEHNFTAYSDDEMKAIAAELRGIDVVGVRGVD